MAISEFIDAVDTQRKTIRVLNKDEPAPLIRMLRAMVASSETVVRELHPLANEPPNAVVLEAEDGTSLGISTISDIADSVLMVNSDLYTTGTRSVKDVATPAVIENLDEITFQVAGKQKMLLIEISRYIESLASQTGTGTLRSGFQFLSRLDDERGTRRVYDAIAESETDLHVYGVPDRVPELAGDVTVHGQDCQELRQSWFVIHSDCEPDAEAALLAERTGENAWRGHWSFDSDHVAAIAEYLADRY